MHGENESITTRDIILFWNDWNVLVFGTLVLPMVVSIRVVVLRCKHFVLLVLHRRSKGSDVSSKDHLLRGSQLAEAALYLFGNWIDHYDSGCFWERKKEAVWLVGWLISKQTMRRILNLWLLCCVLSSVFGTYEEKINEGRGSRGRVLAYFLSSFIQIGRVTIKCDSRKASFGVFSRKPITKPLSYWYYLLFVQYS